MIEYFRNIMKMIESFDICYININSNKNILESYLNNLTDYITIVYILSKDIRGL